MGTVAELWRHPIKSHGREAVTSVDFTAGKCMPWDRHWAVTHDKTKFDGSGWVMCRNFMIGNLTPSLAGLWATFDEAAHEITLRHADLGELTFDADADDTAFLAWVAPLYPDDRPQPKAIVSLPDRGMTDSDYPSIAIMTRSSHAAVQDAAGHEIELERWRGNVWLDGVAPWAELDWVGKSIRIGTAELSIREPIVRCGHPGAHPITGVRDIDSVGLLNNSFGHQHFGVYAVVTKDGHVALGDQAEVL